MGNELEVLRRSWMLFPETSWFVTFYLRSARDFLLSRTRDGRRIGSSQETLDAVSWTLVVHDICLRSVAIGRFDLSCLTLSPE